MIIDSELRAEVQAKLKLEWSPEQIAAYLRTAFPDRPSWLVCPRHTLTKCGDLGIAAGARPASHWSKYGEPP